MFPSAQKTSEARRKELAEWNENNLSHHAYGQFLVQPLTPVGEMAVINDLKRGVEKVGRVRESSTRCYGMSVQETNLNQHIFQLRAAWMEKKSETRVGAAKLLFRTKALSLCSIGSSSRASPSDPLLLFYATMLLARLLLALILILRSAAGVFARTNRHSALISTASPHNYFDEDELDVFVFFSSFSLSRDTRWNLPRPNRQMCAVFSLLSHSLTAAASRR